MECPHCLTSIHPDFSCKSLWDRQEVVPENDRKYVLVYYKTCPECGKYIVYLNFGKSDVSYSGAYRLNPADDGGIRVFPEQNTKDYQKISRLTTLKTMKNLPLFSTIVPKRAQL